MYIRKLTGMYGEDFACKYLEKNNYSILERNFHCYQGEIDIIAKDNLKNELVFIEVKTRTNLNYGYPIESVTINKQNHLFKACNYYLYKNNINNVFIRVDVIEIFLNNGIPYIRHVKQIF